jgi:hypothetical protein
MPQQVGIRSNGAGNRLSVLNFPFSEATPFNVKETTSKAAEYLTTEGHWLEVKVNQAAAGMKPKRVRALIQRGALR